MPRQRRSRSKRTTRTILGTAALLVPLLQACDPVVGEAVTVVVDNAAAGSAPAVNRLVLGSNTEWIYNGDELLQPNSTTFDATSLARAVDLAPTVIRYPGGTLTDAYHWAQGVGPVAARGQNVNAYGGDPQTTYFGTVEMQQLAQAVGAEPLISVNTSTGTAAEAADWVRFTNVEEPAAGAGFPPVRFWEIGNEPYLKNERPELVRTPDQYLAAFNEVVPAMKAVDPTIKVGLPLTTPNLQRFYAPPYATYNETVLSGRTAPVDFAAVHNAYLPFAYNGRPADDQLYLALAAGATASNRDLDALKAVLQSHGLDVPFALTEYSPLVTIGQPSDNLMDSPAGAIYIADLVLQWAGRDDILLANHWSLINNGYFGAIGRGGALRPQLTVLRELERDLRGVRLPVAVTAPTFNAPEVGVQPATADVPTVTAFATSEGARQRIVLINRDAAASHATTVRFTAPVTGTVAQRTFAAFGSALTAYPDGGAPTFTASTLGPIDGTQLSVDLPPQSITVLDTGA
jgi:alpha-N-arabinofuranosidase